MCFEFSWVEVQKLLQRRKNWLRQEDYDVQRFFNATCPHHSKCTQASHMDLQAIQPFVKNKISFIFIGIDMLCLDTIFVQYGDYNDVMNKYNQAQ